MNIVKARKFFYFLSGLLFALSIASLVVRGLNLGVDFKGETRMEVAFSDQTSRSDIQKVLIELGFPDAQIQQSGDAVFQIRTKYLSEAEHEKIQNGLHGEEKNFISIGPSVGAQLRKNSMIAVGAALLAIIIYIAWAFRHVSKPLSSWIYGVVAIVALFHDVVIPTGLFSYLGIEIDTLFITAILTVLGFSVHDTIVVFDRVREHLRKDSRSTFQEVVGRSINETIGRSINTSLTTLFALAAVYFFGGSGTQNLALALIVGIIIGTYSSIFIASTLLVTIAKWKGHA